MIYVYNRGLNTSNISDYQLFQGRLQKITPEEVVLKDYFVLNNNAWESFGRNDKDSGEKTLFFDDEAKLLNLENKNPKTRYDLISVKQFVGDAFSVEEGNYHEAIIPPEILKDKENSHLKHRRDWYGYFFMEGDRVTGGMVSKSIESLLRQRAITAEVASVSKDEKAGPRITVKNAREYSALTGEWIPRTNTLTFNIGGALVVKNGEPVKLSAVKEKDKIYFLRDNNEVKFILIY